MRAIIVFAALSLTTSPAEAKAPPRAVKVYSDCVLENFRNPGDEKSDTFDGAVDLAKAQCGNLRSAAVAAVHKSFGKRLTVGGDDADLAAQAMLDILVEEPAAAIWMKLHPEDGETNRGTNPK